MATRRPTSPRREPDGGHTGSLNMPVLNGAPWYVKLVIWLLVWFGFPVAMCLVLFAVMLGQIPSPITTTAAEMTAHRSETNELLTLAKSSTRLQRQICRNTSSNMAERVACDQ